MTQARLLLALLPATLLGQIVEAPYAQYLATATITRHPELKKIGIHAVPPGKTESQILGSNIPTKLGKKSSPADMNVVTANQPHVATRDGFYDLALPLNNKAGKPVGLLVMELFSAKASGEADALQKAMAIRDEVASKVSGVPQLFGPVPNSEPLALLRSTPLPDITGDFDHFAVDLARNRLYVSAEVHHSIEVFDLKTGEHLRSAPGVTTPHTIAFVPESNRLLVADGGDNSCRILDTTDFHEVAKVPLAGGPDAGVYDAASHIFYVGNGGRPAKMEYSYISAVNADTGKEEQKIRVDAVNLEAMAIDPATRLLYVNLRDKSQVAVVDLKKGTVQQTWSVPDLNLNTPLMLDAVNHRVFLAGRKPGKFFVLDSANGATVTTLDAVETADDMAFDRAAHRIYITGAGGVTVIEQQSADRYRKLAEFATNSGKTAVFVPQLKQFYIIHTKTAEDSAALQVYRVQ